MTLRLLIIGAEIFGAVLLYTLSFVAAILLGTLNLVAGIMALLIGSFFGAVLHIGLWFQHPKKPPISSPHGSAPKGPLWDPDLDR